MTSQHESSRLDAPSLGAHSRALLALLEKPCISGHAWSSVRKDIEGMADTCQAYQEYLESSAIEQTQRQRQTHPVRQVAENMSVSFHSPGSVSNFSNQEEKLDSVVRDRSAFDPLFFDKELLLGIVLIKDQ